MKSCSCVFLFVCMTAIWGSTGVIGTNKVTKLHSFESVIEFELNMRKFEAGQNNNQYCIESSEFELNDITWKIRACRNNESSDKKHVHMSLVSIWDRDSAAWSCEAKATFELLTTSDKEKPVDGSFEYYKFNKDEPIQTIQDFIKWDDLYEKYVDHDDRATFEITISTKTPNRAAKLDESSAKFNIIINNVNNFGYEYSNEVIVRGIRWKILTMKINDHLGIFLFANGDDMGIDVSWKASATFSLSSPTTINALSRSFSDISFDWTNLNHGYFKFIEWSQFTDTGKKFVEKNKAIVKVELSVSEPMKNT